MDFLSVNFPFSPILRGGGQQGGLRSGTENTDGIYSLKLALEELVESQKNNPMATYMDDFKKELVAMLGDQANWLESQSEPKSVDFLYYSKKQKADITLIAFDLDSLDVSSGSACSSGALEPSRVLTTMGYNEDDAKSALRISFPFYFSASEYKEMKEKVFRVLSRFK